MSACVAAIDCGTSAVKAAIIDLRGNTLSEVSRPVPCRHGIDGAVEQDPLAIQAAAFDCLKTAVNRRRRPGASVDAVCVTNQRATVIPIGAAGQPLASAISWQDMRGAPYVAALRRRLDDAAYYAITGLPYHTVFTLGKILFLRARFPALFRKTRRFALVHDYLLKALGCDDFYLDYANASLTGLFDNRRLQWSAPILALAGLAANRLPVLVRSGQAIGVVSRAASRRCGLTAGTPIVSGAGDQQCAGMGSGAVTPGICSITLGTAGVCFCHTDRVARDPRRRIACCAHAVPGAWNLEGLQNAAGDSVRWAAGRLAGAQRLDRAFLRSVAAIAPGARDVLFYPYLAGAAAPHWIGEATASFLGLKYSHDSACLFRAVLEGVAFENRQILDVFASLRVPIREIRLTGGFSKWTVWNQIQADIYNRPLYTLENQQATLLGAAILAALGIGAAASAPAAVRRMVRVADVFKPRREAARAYIRIYAKYGRIMAAFKQQSLFPTIASR
ncbi:MAG: FGGY family carbohydrate kinase [Kiritimatiellia bacterium]|jgi:xylulokinase